MDDETMVPGRDWAAYLAEVSEDLLARGEEPVTLERVVSRGVEVAPRAAA